MFKKILLDTHITKNIMDSSQNGNLTVIWRDWDNLIDSPKMIYITSVFPGEVKGPHLHLKRDSYFLCIEGKVMFVIMDENGIYHEIEADSNNPFLLYVPKNIASAHININKEISKVLVLANLAWRPNDNEMKNVSFDNYNWKKFQVK